VSARFGWKIVGGSALPYLRAVGPRTALAAMVIASCGALAPANAQPRQTLTHEQASAIADGVIATFATRDPLKLVQRYTDNRVMLDSEHDLPYTDDARFRQFAEGLMSLKPTQRVLHREITILDADTFVNTAVGAVSLSMPEGPATFRVRYTQVFQKQRDGSWKVAVEHLSNAPEAP
jgi:hypothetical protein